ncbi:hypothetical protein SAMN02983011_01207 [Lactobacillus kefiranofaciens]|uniref:Uncharacterized protein n=1 Tax=Lactobacillus kefiranofaciens TaxID=267818 RepID=A0ABY0MBJ9_9LACO|nr:hypothetical protein SAMN02983011_01207 [Lactobacillus kefiranofaciens]
MAAWFFLMMEDIMELKHGRNSFFDGGLFALIGWHILGFLVTFLTLGIC